MITWIALKLGLSQLVVKLILSAVAIAAISYGLRLWGNRQWYKGESAGRQYVSKEIEKQKAVEWKAKEDAIAASAATIAAEKRAIKTATEQLAQDRATITRGLKDGLAAVATARERDYATTANVPDDLLDGAIRTISRQLAATP